MGKWRHSGFSVHCGPRILPRQKAAMENLGRYIIRASFSQERLDYDAQTATVVYKGKDGRRQKSFDALEWLAAMCSHVPNKGEQMVRYYGYYDKIDKIRGLDITITTNAPTDDEARALLQGFNFPFKS